jgi:hypothetical protein
MAQQGSGFVVGAAAVVDDAGGVGAKVLDLDGASAWVEGGQARVSVDLGGVACGLPDAAVIRSRYLANPPTRPTTEGPRSAPTYIRGERLRVTQLRTVTGVRRPERLEHESLGSGRCLASSLRTDRKST